MAMPRTHRVNPPTRKVSSMNAANNLALMQIGPAVADHDSQAMNEPATKQDLYNMGVQIDSNFGKVISQFTIVDSEFVNLRTDMNTGFDKVYSRFEIVDSQFANLRTDMDAKFDKANDALNKTFFKFGSLFFTMMFAVLSIDRWWR